MIPTDAVSFSRLRASQTPLLSITEDLVHVGEADEGEVMFVHLVVKQDQTAVRVRLEKWTWQWGEPPGVPMVTPKRHLQNVTGAIEIPLTDLPNTISKYILDGKTSVNQLSINDILTAFEADLNGESKMWGTSVHRRIKGDSGFVGV